MRVAALVLGLMLSVSWPAAAQEWDLYVFKEDGVKVNFPGPPNVTEAPWKTEYGFTVPSRIYRGQRGPERYSLTVVDYNGIEKQGMERSAKCPAGAETCLGQTAGDLLTVIGPSYAIQDIRGAIAYATLKFLQRDAKVTAYTWNFEDLVEGYQINLTNNADQSRTMAFIAMHENKLYVLEGTAPKGYPEPGLFFQSLGWVDKDGNGIRYQAVYSNEFHGLRIYPVPPIRRAGAPGGGAPGGGGAPAPAGGGR